MPVLGIGVNLLMMAGLGASNWARLLVWLAIGLAIYFGRRRGRAVRLIAETAGDAPGQC